MRGMVPLDPETSVSQACFAIVYVPRRMRTRFPASCVQVVDSAEEALQGADVRRKQYAARLAGPSKSSEGQFIYYLLEWLQ